MSDIILNPRHDRLLTLTEWKNKYKYCISCNELTEKSWHRINTDFQEADRYFSRYCEDCSLEFGCEAISDADFVYRANIKLRSSEQNSIIITSEMVVLMKNGNETVLADWPEITLEHLYKLAIIV